MITHKLGILLALTMGLGACQNMENKQETNISQQYKQGSFAYDLDFLKSKGEVFVLTNRSGEAQVVVSAKYQGKVFTSTAEGPGGKSFGWINYQAFDGEQDPHMNAYGGENRLWLGPEGGKFSIFFAPGSDMEFKNWVTPPAIDTESWELISSNEREVSLQKESTLLNYAGTKLNTRIQRQVRILENEEIERKLGLHLDTAKVKAVGFSTDNTLTNVGKEAWTRESGAPCIWILDMFTPSATTTSILPYNTDVHAGKGLDAQSRVATTDYFGEIPEDRIQYENGVLFFKADGKSRGKIGLGPERAKPIAGSYDAENKILTLTTFDVDPEAVYLNQEWSTDKDPFQGDAVNAYNDGPLEDGSQMGPFYEIESVSPAAFLQAGQSLSHQHQVFHFTGNAASLDQIAQKVLGVSLEKVQEAFQ